MTITLRALTIAAVVFLSLSAPLSGAAEGRANLGGGYTCDIAAKLIYKGNSSRTVTLSKAKKTLNGKISDLGTSKKDKAKKAVLKAAKTAVQSCADGTFTVSPTPTPGSGKPGLDQFCERFPRHPRCR